MEISLNKFIHVAIFSLILLVGCNPDILRRTNKLDLKVYPDWSISKKQAKKIIIAKIDSVYKNADTFNNLKYRKIMSVEYSEYDEDYDLLINVKDKWGYERTFCFDTNLKIVKTSYGVTLY